MVLLSFPSGTKYSLLELNFRLQRVSCEIFKKKRRRAGGAFQIDSRKSSFCAISEAIDLNLNNKVFFEEISASVKVVDIIEGGKFQSIE